MKDKKNILIAVLIFLDFYLLFRIYSHSVVLKDNTHSLTESMRVTKETFNEFEDELFDFQLKCPPNNAAYTFLVFIKTHDCSDCVHNEINILNKIYKKGIPVVGYVIPDEIEFSEFMNMYNFGFPLAKVDDYSLCISESLKRTPCILVVNDSGQIVDTYISLPNDFERQKRFCRTWDRLLNLKLYE